MDTCSTEIITLIIEHACSGDGHTARCLGLVSKYFRAIAEPIELRTIEIAGLKQLQGAVARLDRFVQSSVYEHEERVIDVRHLFISEMTKEHALAADTDFDNGYNGERNSFWMTEEGKATEKFYLEHSDAFWTLATALVRRTSPTLRTLFMLASNNWFTWRGMDDLYETPPKALGALSGIIFPRLEPLTVDRNSTSEVKSIVYKGGRFESLEMPSLRSLNIVSWIIIYKFHSDPGLPDNLHRLLTSLYPKCRESELLIVGYTIDIEELRVEDLLKAVFKKGWKSLLRTRTLRMFPKAGQKVYELLLAEWKEQCSA